MLANGTHRHLQGQRNMKLEDPCNVQKLVLLSMLDGITTKKFSYGKTGSLMILLTVQKAIFLAGPLLDCIFTYLPKSLSSFVIRFKDMMNTGGLCYTNLEYFVSQSMIRLVQQ